MSAPDKKDWDKLLKDMLNGTANPDKNGFYAIDKGYKRTKDTDKPTLKLVSPSQASVDLAKAEKRDRKKHKKDTLSL